MSVEFDEEGLKNIIYILGSEKGLGSIDKFFFLILQEMAFVLSILFECLSLISIIIGFLAIEKRLGRCLLKHFSSLLVFYLPVTLDKFPW